MVVPSVFRSKAVSAGAVSFFLTKFVRARIARLTYGVTMNVHWDGNNSQHQQRRSKLFYLPSGSPVLPGGFQSFIAKVRPMVISDIRTFTLRNCYLGDKTRGERRCAASVLSRVNESQRVGQIRKRYYSLSWYAGFAILDGPGPEYVFCRFHRDDLLTLIACKTPTPHSALSTWTHQVSTKSRSVRATGLTTTWSTTRSC